MPVCSADGQGIEDERQEFGPLQDSYTFWNPTYGSPTNWPQAHSLSIILMLREETCRATLNFSDRFDHTSELRADNFPGSDMDV